MGIWGSNPLALWVPNWSLRLRLVGLVLLAVLPALGLTLYTASEHRRFVAIDVKANVQQLAGLASGRQEDLVEGARQLLVAFAQLPQVRDPDPAACNKLFADLLNQYPLYTNFGAVRADGTVFCSAVPLKRDSNLRNRPYFQRAVQTRNFTVGDYQVGRITGKPSLNFGYPIFDRAGLLKTVVFAALDVERLNRLLAEAQLPPKAAILLLDRNGTILARSPDAQRWVGKSVPEAELVRTIFSQKKGIAELPGIDGVPRLHAFESLRSTVETGLYMSVGIPTEVAYAEADQLLRNNLLGLGIVAAISLLAAWFGGRFIVLRPIEQALEQAEHKYLKIFENAVEGIFQVTIDGRCLTANPMLALLYGYDSAESVMRDENHAANYSQLLERLAREDVIWGLESQVRHNDGTTVWVSQSARALRDEQNQLIGCEGTVVDITERKRAEEEFAWLLRREAHTRAEAQANEERFRFLAESIPQIIWTARPDGYLDYYNQRWFDYTGMSLEETQGWGWEPILHPDDRQPCIDCWDKAVRTGEPYEIKYRFKRASDGTYRWHLGRALAQRDAEGRVVKWFGTCTDIDDQQHAEQALLEARSTLEQRVAERTAELTHTNTLLEEQICEREQAERYLSTQLAVTQVLAESATLSEATPKLLWIITESLGWDLGELWMVDKQAGLLRFVENWHSPRLQIPLFEAATHLLAFAPGVGLPGQIWASGRPVWFTDLISDQSFQRARTACEEGLRGAFGFPIVAGGGVLGVMTFFSQQQQSSDEELLAILAAIGSQTGQFIERRRAETALNKEQEFLEALLNNLSDGIVACDAEGVLTLFNPATRKLHGLPEEAISPRHWAEHYDLYLADGATRMGKEDIPLFRALHGEHVRNVEMVIAPKNKEARTVVADGQAIYDIQGRKLGAVAVMRDITERKRAEQALERQVQRSLLLGQITQEIRSSLDSKQIFQTTATQIGQAFRVDRCVLHTYIETPYPRVPFVAEYLTPGWESLLSMEVPVAGNPLMECLLAQEQAIASPDVEVEPLFEAALPLARRAGIRSMLAIRTSYQGKPNGVIGLQQCSGIRHWTQEEIELLEAVAAQVGIALSQAQLLEQEQHQRQQLVWQAEHDSLTGLWNRRAFKQSLTTALEDTQQHSHHTLCYLDLDQFKIVNDTCGHAAGDELLRQVSALLQANLRASDILARLGGDEFGLLLLHCPLESVQVTTDSLIECLNRFRFTWGDNSFTLGVSIGAAAVDMHTHTLDSLLSAADAACSAAKNNGRNRVCIWKPDDEELLQQQGQVQWVTRIHRALEENAFCLYHQPIAAISPDARTGEHYEVLLRLREGDKIISPMAFIPAAERYNLMGLIDRWVIHALFSSQNEYYRRNWKRVREEGCEYLYCVNLSGASINDEQFVDFITEQFRIHDVPPQLICFEITETIAIANLSKASQLIYALKNLGCHFALDDFGSGTSSFSYLKNLPVDYLKIDGTFVKDIVKDPVDRAIVASITNVARLMNVRTIAEYVENDAILDCLRDLGLDYAQGYGIARPRPLLDQTSNIGT
ncbi:MAG: EAL domain-containing protein [Gemmatimonadaceae bacterium]|nr:EAL domain-containing protein [Gloeobacterales cyanobacterium ES-bin-141]